MGSETETVKLPPALTPERHPRPVIPAEARGPKTVTLVQFGTTLGRGGVMGPGFGCAAPG
jgi:hypothetical protein